MVVARIWLLLILCSVTAQASTEAMVLGPGDQRMVELSTGLDAQVSRKGVIDLEHGGDDVWLIRGLRAGVVVIRWFNQDGELIANKMVEVINTGKRLGHFPSWACNLSGITCDRERRLIRGRLNRPDDWLQAKAWCQKRDDCWFDVELEPDGWSEVQRRLTARSQGGRWTIDDTRLVFYGRCDETFRDLLVERLGSLAAAVDSFQCEDRPEERFRVRLKLVAMNRDTANKIGLDVKRGALLPQPQEAWQIVAKSMESKNQVQLIGEPSLVVQKGAAAKMSSGGEFQVFYDSAGEKGTIREGWKKYGLNFQVKPANEGAYSEMVQLTMDLTSRSPGGEESLGSYSVESQVPLVDGGKYLLSVATVSRQSHGEQSAFSLGSIPILGPLLKIVDRDEVYRFLAIWAFTDRESR